MVQVEKLASRASAANGPDECARLLAQRDRLEGLCRLLQGQVKAANAATAAGVADGATASGPAVAQSEGGDGVRGDSSGSGSGLTENGAALAEVQGAAVVAGITGVLEGVALGRGGEEPLAAGREAEAVGAL